MGWLGINAQERIYWERFRTGNRVDVVVDVGMERTYASRIKDVKSDRLIVDVPRIGNLVLETEPKTEVAVSVYTDEGVFKFVSKILAFHWEESACHIAQPKAIERVQRRQSYRLEKIIPVQYSALLSYDGATDPDRIPANSPAVAKNISEGGALLVLNDRFMGSETFLKVQVALDAEVTISAIARVLDQKPHPEVPGKVITRVQFVTIKDADKEEISKFVLRHTHKNV